MTKLSPQEIEEIKDRILDYPSVDIDNLLSHIESQDKEIEKLMEALKFYADEANWSWQETPAGEDTYKPAIHDEGDIARESLK